MAPSRSAIWNSSAGVSLEENMMFSPVMPHRSEIINSVMEEQSQPQPSSCSSFSRAGVGAAFTAKYSR